MNPVQTFLKRSLDLLIASSILILASPIFIACSLAIVIFDGFPVLFTQDRPGFHGKIFKIFKFRTMNVQRPGEDLSDHHRMTKLGTFMRKTSLDELPQVLNVIKGDLSLVGPRPLLIEYLPLYNERQKKRHTMKPGITGWAQVNGRNTISWEQKFDYDVWYVENWSLGLDLKILVLTFLKVAKRSGVNASSQVTMEKFKGSKSE
ncbi:MAG: sugar transferase [Bdellovibrionales bacterium]|nr:sugar transferase [Bdellovibrionales bacterium]